MANAEKMNRLVLVCDGAKALFLADSGIAPQPKLKVLETVAEAHPSTQDQGTDRPGRVYASKGESRSAVEVTDFHAAAEDAFLRRIAGRLGEWVDEGNASRILIVAAPKALGTLREALSPQVQSMVDAEIAKDLVKLPVDEIERHIAA